MQVSVLPFLHAYGDAKPEEVYKQSKLRKALGLHYHIEAGE
jgi:hypothetical protein